MRPSFSSDTSSSARLRMTDTSRRVLTVSTIPEGRAMVDTGRIGPDTGLEPTEPMNREAIDRS